ncbi:unnamed protein product [Brassica rapa]|uniref:RING-type E3 ubiquitin transferase n=2 Tax=Brassica TaxID=3705 RepID=A0A078FLZ9_BRANA|nr:unnamed protein product [Brassica napus]CAG7876446.1 unnamed protein product [Brassica rapa]CDY13338.1 BnaC06g14190D [Brassica napus]VDC71604.1 unnamed protein product [Brassica rapa]
MVARSGVAQWSRILGLWIQIEFPLFRSVSLGSVVRDKGSWSVLPTALWRVRRFHGGIGLHRLESQPLGHRSCNSNPQNYSSPTTANSPELKLYQAFIFTVPICFTFIILFIFYIIYLRCSRADLSSLGMRTTFLVENSISTAVLGLRKELREILPIVVCFSAMDSLCSVCLGDYQADDKLQQILSGGHTFHMDCIDLWLTSHSTCPLCRLTLIPTHSHQGQDEDPPIPNLRTPDGGVSSQPETQPEDHGSVGQCDPNEGDRDAENSKETREDEQNSIGTSIDCCNCRLG